MIRPRLIIAFLLISSGLHAHEGHHMNTLKPDPAKEEAEMTRKKYEQINEDFQKVVKPIFEKSCFDCHSQTPRLPWYHPMPIVNGMIEADMKEAKEHLDFSNGYPFQGHGNPKSDLEAISEEIEKDEMPPLRYRIMHWGSSLSSEEKKQISHWIQTSVDLLQKRDR